MRAFVLVLALVAVDAVDARAQSAAAPAALAIDAGSLDAPQRAAFDKILADEVCPCDCPRTFGQCLQPGTRCRPAVILGEYIVDSLASGAPADDVAEALAKDLANGFLAAPKKPVLDGYAAKGSKKPKTTIVEYADFECGHCKAASSVIEELVKKHPEVQVVFKHMPLSFHAMAKKAAIAAEAAGLQGKFWPMHDAIFATQEFLTDDLLVGHAKAIGLDVEKFKRDIADPALAKKVDDARAEGAAYGFNATPSFLIDGRPYYLYRSVDGFELRLRMDAARATSTCQ
jgi:protein-disulfide isomerase